MEKLFHFMEKSFTPHKVKRSKEKRKNIYIYIYIHVLFTAPISMHFSNQPEMVSSLTRNAWIRRNGRIYINTHVSELSFIIFLVSLIWIEYYPEELFSFRSFRFSKKNSLGISVSLIHFCLWMKKKLTNFAFNSIHCCSTRLTFARITPWDRKVFLSHCCSVSASESISVCLCAGRRFLSEAKESLDFWG